MRTDCSADLFGFEPVEGRRFEAAFDGGTMTSDAGALLLGRADRRLGLLRRFAACFVDGRSSDAVEHTIERLVVLYSKRPVTVSALRSSTRTPCRSKPWAKTCRCTSAVA